MKKSVYRAKYYGVSEELPEVQALTDTDEQTIADVQPDAEVPEDKKEGILGRIFGGNK